MKIFSSLLIQLVQIKIYNLERLISTYCLVEALIQAMILLFCNSSFLVTTKAQILARYIICGTRDETTCVTPLGTLVNKQSTISQT